MAVYRAKISKSQFLKEDSPIVKDRIFYIVFKVGQAVYRDFPMLGMALILLLMNFLTSR